MAKKGPATSVCCPRCGTPNPRVANFCRACGLSLVAAQGHSLAAGGVRHPQAMPPPGGHRPVAGAVDLYYKWESGSGGPPLFGTETLAVEAFNAGYALCEVTLALRGLDRNGLPVVTVQREATEWPQGEVHRFEIPSYELPQPVADIEVELLAARFALRE